ncbi:hypothetical protein, partial [Nocardia salmonicida]
MDNVTTATSILFTLGLIALYRLGAALPSPGVDYQNVQECVKVVS